MSEIARWTRELEAIRFEVMHALTDRRMWEAMMDALEASPADDRGYFADHYATLYVAGEVMRVRRLADPRGGFDTISLGRLLKSIRDNPTPFSRERYAARFVDEGDDREWARNESRERGEAEWDREWAAPDGQLDVNRIDLDIETLTGTVKRVKAFADRTIAHIDRRGVQDLPTFNDLNTSMDALASIVCRYELLLTGKGWTTLDATIQGDWKAPFRIPLFAADD